MRRPPPPSRLAIAPLLLALTGCGGHDPNEPPPIRYGDSVCVECDMIISDERWATATIIEGPRGSEALPFDDFNCQIIHEATRPDLTILRRWAHDHGTRAWIDPETAHFVRAKSIRTPMASNVAAFALAADAESMAKASKGSVASFEEVRRALLPEATPPPHPTPPERTAAPPPSTAHTPPR